jgi:hypothetical protein
LFGSRRWFRFGLGRLSLNFRNLGLCYCGLNGRSGFCRRCLGRFGFARGPCCPALLDFSRNLPA